MKTPEDADSSDRSSREPDQPSSGSEASGFDDALLEALWDQVFRTFSSKAIGPAIRVAVRAEILEAIKQERRGQFEASERSRTERPVALGGEGFTNYCKLQVNQADSVRGNPWADVYAKDVKLLLAKVEALEEMIKALVETKAPGEAEAPEPSQGSSSDRQSWILIDRLTPWAQERLLHGLPIHHHQLREWVRSAIDASRALDEKEAEDARPRPGTSSPGKVEGSGFEVGHVADGEDDLGNGESCERKKTSEETVIPNLVFCRRDADSSTFYLRVPHSWMNKTQSSIGGLWREVGEALAGHEEKIRGLR